MYKLLVDEQGNALEIIKRTSDGAYIPFDARNSDYQDYLKWLEEGNTPEPADK